MLLHMVKIVNTNSIPEGAEIDESLGLVRGNTVEARNAGRDLTQSIRNFFGGELKGYTELLTKARNKAQQEAVEEAEELGADAIINIRFDTSSITPQASEVLVYGTAVTLKKD